MRADGPDLRLSPSDLSGFLGCRHRTGLDLAVAMGNLARPAWSDPVAQALRDRGAEHERAYVDYLRAQGLGVVGIDGAVLPDARVADTLAAMRGGADVIVQAALVSGGSSPAGVSWLGYADILQRVPVASALGSWSYEPCDTKLARETRGGTILQLTVYVDLLEQVQHLRPERFWVVTPGEGGGFAATPYRAADYDAYVRVVHRQFQATLALGSEAILAAHYPEPVEHCDVCRWSERCNARRRADDHLAFIAGIGRVHREELSVQGVPTLTAAAGMAVPILFKPTRGSRETYERFHHQARVQVEQKTLQRPVHELLPVEDDQGLARLPEPSPGDLFLDLEGARFAREGGREYLFGIWGRLDTAPDTPPAYDGGWAFIDAEERAAFEAAMDRIARTLAVHPGAHIYHFGHYEPTTFKRLMGRYATRGDEIDSLLRAGRFVDLHTVMRQALRAGVESYSIKQLEQFYGFTRAMPLKDASVHLHAIELALESRVPQAVPEASRLAVQAYNEDDCRSTEALRDWLESLRTQLVAQGTEVPRPVAEDGAASDKVRELEQRQAAAREALLAGVSTDAATDPMHPQHPLWLLAYLLDWHRREDKSQYWERYRLAELSDEELLDERQALAGLTFVERVEESRFKNGNFKSAVDRYAYPPQEVELGREGELRVGNVPFGSIVGHDRVLRTIDIKKGKKVGDQHPTAVYQAIVVATDIQQEALLRFAEAPDATTCATDLLFRRPPRPGSGAFQTAEGESVVDFAVRLATDLDRTTLAIQGPPGAGKTYAGARMIRALVHAGKRVGVTAMSHKVIRNLLAAVHLADPTAALGHKCTPDETDDCATDPPVVEYADNAEALGALASGEVAVLGGTCWLWARPEAAAAVDVLFVDEAGQMSLANALAVSGAASSLVLLGDPQQLEQPQKGSHPDGVGISALDHVLGGAATMPPDRGLFLPLTWRLHPALCAFTSELFYEGKLQSKPGLQRQRLTGTGRFDGAGLWWVPVAHDGNRNASMEEVEAVAGIVDQLLAPGARWDDERGVSRALTAADLRVVAPYNAQVNRLAERLAGRSVPVGTVDKFQGQEAPVVIYSMATSRPEDAPRGMEFLYSLNRLNVATSRARCAAIVAASPRLLEPACRTPRQMALANALCRYVELATYR
jgi:predicted RecB family nuclease